MTAGDAIPLAAIEFDPAVKRFLALPEDPQDVWLAKFDASAYGGYVIEVQGQLAGRGSVLRYRQGRKGYAELVVVVGKQWWGQGLGRKVAASLLQIAFERGNAKGVVAVVHPEHEASIALLRSLGFRKRSVVTAPPKPWQQGHLMYRLPRRAA